MTDDRGSRRRSSGSGNKRVVDRRLAIVEGNGRGQQRVIRIDDKRERVKAGGGASDVGARCSIPRGTRRSLENADVRDPGIIPLDSDVHAVFKSQLDSILQRDFQLTLANELLDARSIGEGGGRHLDGVVGRKEVRKRSWSAREMIFRCTEGDGRRRVCLGLRGRRWRRILRRVLRISWGDGASYKRHRENYG